MLRKFVIAAAAFLLVALDVGAAELSVKYNQESRELAFSGNLTESGKYVVVTVLPSDADRENAERFDDIAVKVIKPGASGDFDEVIILPQSFKGNEYKLYASSGNIEVSKSFVHINEEEAAKILALLIGKTKPEFEEVIKTNHMALGITEAKLSENERDMLDYLYAQQPSKGYTVGSFSKAMRRIDGIIAVRSGAGWIDMLREYENDFGVDVEKDYDPISDDAKELVKAAIEKYDVFNIDFSAEFMKSVVIAEVRSAKNYSELKEIIEKHAAFIGLDTSEYDKLDDYYRGYTFEKMYEQSINEYEEIETEFNAAVKKAADEKKRKSGEKSSSSGGGGGGGGKKGFSSVPKAEPAAPNNDEIKTDIDGHWAKESMTELKKRGVINGYPDGTYRPDGLVTRAEFLKMLTVSFNIAQSEKVFFNDTSAGDWFTPYVSGGYEGRIIFGDGENFRPNENITREDAAVMLARCLKLSGGSAAFDDDGEIAGYAKGCVAALANKKILQGSDGKFMPKKNTTRAESAQMIYNAIKGE